jgi:hypothetical protein
LRLSRQTPWPEAAALALVALAVITVEFIVLEFIAAGFIAVGFIAARPYALEWRSVSE